MTGDRIYRIQETGYRELGTAGKRRTYIIGIHGLKDSQSLKNNRESRRAGQA
jgi:hypothetical protein